MEQNKRLEVKVRELEETLISVKNKNVERVMLAGFIALAIGFVVGKTAGN